MSGNRSFLAFAIGTLLVCLSGAASAQNFRAGADFWTPPKSVAECRASYRGIPPYKLAVTLTREPYPNDNAVNFVTTYGMWLSDIIAGQNIAKHKNKILKIAAADTFTEADMGKGWSPIYVQSNLIRTTAMVIRALEAKGQLKTEERQTLLNWGDKMIPGQKQSRQNGSADSRMASGVAMMSWGNVKNDAQLMKAGYRKFMSGYDYVLNSIGNLRRHPAHRHIPIETLSLENEYNIALQHAVEGAAILNNLGVDLAAYVKNGQNLHAAVEWWTGYLINLPVQGEFSRAWAHNYHVGWIPIYVSQYRDQPASSKLKAYGRKVTAGRAPKFRAASLGGATECLW
jgi:hypothetical protein